MAIGGLSAYLLFERNQQLQKLLTLKYIKPLIMVLIAAGLFGWSTPWLLGVLFALLILVLITKPFSSKILNSAGVVSYGIYMYHPIAMFISYAAVHQLQRHYGAGNILSVALPYVFTLLITFIISKISYHGIESKLLRLKTKFQIVKSE